MSGGLEGERTICETGKYSDVKVYAWAHGSGSFPIFDKTNSLEIADKIRQGPPSLTLIDGFQALNYIGQESIFTYDHRAQDEATTVDLLGGFKPSDIVLAGDFITDSARIGYQALQQSNLILNFLSALGVGITPVLGHKIYKYIRGEQRIDLNRKIGGRRNFLKYSALIAGLSIFSGVAFEKFDELRRILVATEINSCSISPVTTLSEGSVSFDTADLYDRTWFSFERIKGIPEKELTDRGLQKGKRQEILGTAHYYPKVMQKLEDEDRSVSARAQEIVIREAKYYASNGYDKDTATHRLERLIVLMARSMFANVERVDENIIALKPIPNAQGEIYYRDPRILPNYFSQNNKLNGKAIAQLLSETEDNLHTV